MLRDLLDDFDWVGWLITLIMLSAFWPVGVILLIRQLSKISKQTKKRQKEREKEERAAASRDERPAAKRASTRRSSANSARSKKAIDKLPSGRLLTIIGSALAGIFGLALLTTIGDIFSYGWYSYHASDLFTLFGFFASGLVCIGAGQRRRSQIKRFRKYLAYIGKNKSISLTALAAAMGKREKAVYDDLQEMLDSGVLPTGYIDLAAGRLVLSDEGIADFVPEPEPQPQPQPEKVEEDENAILQEIRAVNDAIPDEVMSAKIDRIGEITGKILDYQRSHPSKSGQLRSFLNYYLPTTLKVLRAYAQLDAQGIEGENISAAKKRIEGMMDQVVDGFEKQLDKLFQDDALDITSDVEVLENMLRQDGLSGGGMTFQSEMSAGTSAQQSYLDLQKVADELQAVIKDEDGQQGTTLSL